MGAREHPSACIGEKSLALRPQPHAGRHGDAVKSQLIPLGSAVELLAWLPIVEGHKVQAVTGRVLLGRLKRTTDSAPGPATRNVDLFRRHWGI